MIVNFNGNHNVSSQNLTAECRGREILLLFPRFKVQEHGKMSRVGDGKLGQVSGGWKVGAGEKKSRYWL